MSRGCRGNAHSWRALRADSVTRSAPKARRGTSPPVPPLALIPSKEGGCLLGIPRDPEKSAPAPFVLGQTVRRLSYGLEPGQTVAPGDRMEAVSVVGDVEVAEMHLGLAPLIAGHAELDVAVAEAVQRPVGGQHRFDAGLDQGLVPGARGPHVGELADHLPAFVTRVVDEDRRLAGPAPSAPSAG